MDDEEFRKQAICLVDYIVDYKKKIIKRQVMAPVEPGYLKKLIPPKAPEQPEPFADILMDVDTKIMQGMAHWNHPRFLAYFPTSNSYPSILAEMLNAMFGSVGFSWVSVWCKISLVYVQFCGEAYQPIGN
jgi:glutamate/tyrosine decarboxylase-like PLP-dependent enzyme